VNIKGIFYKARWYAVGILVCLNICILGIGGYSIYNMNMEIKGLKTIRNEIDFIGRYNTTMGTELTNIKRKLGIIEMDVMSIKKEVNFMGSDVNSIGLSVNNIKREISNIQLDRSFKRSY
jgi:hypothetical protein